MEKVALVTGASSGIGLDTAFKLLKKGYKVYGAARHTDLIKPIEEKGGKALYLDLTDPESITQCVKTIVEEEGRLDILINNAGYGLGGPLECVPIEEAKRQFEVNVFGLAEMTRAVLPVMRAQRSGKIINISSVAGRFSSPFLGWYHATKYSVEALSDTLRLEVRPFGISVVLIEPGMIKTPWGKIAADNLRKYSQDTAYSQNASNVADFYDKNYSEKGHISGPEVISNTILKACQKKHPKARYLAGKNAKTIVNLRKMLSDRAYDFVASRIFGFK